MRRLLLAALLLGLASPARAQESGAPPPPAAAEEPATGGEEPAAEVAAEPAAPVAEPSGPAAGAATAPDGTPDYAAWSETAARAAALSESGRGSTFALGQLRGKIVDWREVFAAAQAANAARIATVGSQIEALGPGPAEGEPAEDERIAARRAALLEEFARLRAPGVLAEEAFVQATGLIGEIDALTRSRTAAALLTRGATPLDPRLWPEMADAVSSRALGLWKEVTVSLQSDARHRAFARDWPLAMLFLVLATVTLVLGRRWLRLLRARLSVPQARGRLRGQHGANVIRFGLSLGEFLVPLLGLYALSWAAGATGLFGARAMALIGAVPDAGACVLAASWLSAQFFAADRTNPPPFDFAPAVRASAATLLRLAGWVLAADVLLRAFLATAEITPEAKSGLLLPIDLLLAWTVFRFARCLAGAQPEAGQGPEDDLMAFRRSVVRAVATMIMIVAAVAPVLTLLGFSRAGSALLLPSVITLGLLGLLVALQWFVTDLYAVLTRREDGLRDALLPVVAGIVLSLVALPVLALIWGARPLDLLEAWQRFLSGFTLGETRISPRQFAVFGVIFGLGWFLTRLVQGTLRATVLPRTRLDPGAQNAIISGLGYVGIILAALLAVSLAGLDLSNLAIVAGALSVGIGFGLQNIVQNFVSGIILLIERPISEGDWIEVGGRMGYVRDISVRSTRIETFDRTDVIVPNGDLVAGQVVNFTRGNLVGRIVMPVSVAFGNDVDRVTRLLRDAAEANPMVLLSPPPAVVLAGFGADILNFEIRAIIRDVNFGVQTRSEINQAIARRFLEEGIHTAATPPPPPPVPKPVA